MAAPVPQIFTPVFDKLDASLTSYVSDTSSDVIGAIAPVASQMMALYFIIYGIALMRGMIQEMILDFTMRVLRISIITGCALNVGFYNGEIASFLWNTPTAMTAVVTDGTYVGGGGINFLDNVFSNMYELGRTIWDSASGISAIAPGIVAILVWCGAVIVTGYAAFLLVLAKVGLALVLALGPIFILLLMFDATKQFFNSWMGQALNFIFVAILTAAVLSLILILLNEYLEAAIPRASAGAYTSAAMESLVISVIAFLVLMQVNQLASALGGGVAISTLGAAGALFKKLQGGMGGLSQGVKDRVTGKTTANKRAEVLRRDDINARWAARQNARGPGMASRGASMAMDVYRKKIASPNRVNKA